jgi:hypothetical protein
MLGEKVARLPVAGGSCDGKEQFRWAEGYPEKTVFKSTLFNLTPPGALPKIPDVCAISHLLITRMP